MVLAFVISTTISYQRAKADGSFITTINLLIYVLKGITQIAMHAQKIKMYYFVFKYSISLSWENGQILRYYLSSKAHEVTKSKQ